MSSKRFISPANPPVFGHARSRFVDSQSFALRLLSMLSSTAKAVQLYDFFHNDFVKVVGVPKTASLMAGPSRFQAAVSLIQRFDRVGFIVALL